MVFRNRLRNAKCSFFKGQNVYFKFRIAAWKDGAHSWTESDWLVVPNAFVVNHDFRSWRPWENANQTSGDFIEGYAQLQVSKIDLDAFERDTGHSVDKDTKVRFQGQIYSIQGWDQFVQRDMLMFDLKRWFA